MKALKYMMMGMLVSLTASCGNDWLDVESSTKIPTETAIQNLDDVEYSLNGIYDVMRSTNYYSGRMIYYGDVTGDDAQSIKTGKRTTSYYMLDYTKDSGPSSHWSYAYKIIQNCNIILSQIDGLDVSEDDTEYFNDLKGPVKEGVAGGPERPDLGSPWICLVRPDPFLRLSVCQGWRSFFGSTYCDRSIQYGKQAVAQYRCPVL